MKRRQFLQGLLAASAAASGALALPAVVNAQPTVADAVRAYCDFVVGQCAGAIITHPDMRGAYEYWPWDLDAGRLRRIRELGARIYSRVDGADLVEAEARRRGWVTVESSRDWYRIGRVIGPDHSLAIARTVCV